MGITQKPLAQGPKGVADVVICIDITGSMAGCIEGVKRNASSFFDGLKNPANQQPIEWQATVVGYRDADADGSYAFEGFDKPFSTDVEELKARVSGFEAKGGGDAEESLLDALYKISTELPWPHEVGQAHRIVLAFTDADAKAEVSASIKGSGDRSANAVIDELGVKRVKLFLWGPDTPILKQLGTLRKSQFTPVTPDRLEGAAFDEVMKQAADTVSGSTVGGVAVGPSGGGPR